MVIVPANARMFVVFHKVRNSQRSFMTILRDEPGKEQIVISLNVCERTGILREAVSNEARHDSSQGRKVVSRWRVNPLIPCQKRNSCGCTVPTDGVSVKTDHRLGAPTNCVIRQLEEVS
jgi:hypothetical protein